MSAPRIHKQSHGWGSIVRVGYHKIMLGDLEVGNPTEHVLIKWDAPEHADDWHQIDHNDTIENFSELARLWIALNQQRNSK